MSSACDFVACGRDTAPVAADFNAQDYATLVAHPSPYGYLCFHPHPDPTKVRIVERQRNEGEARLLDTTIGRTVLLLPVALDRAAARKRKFVIVDTGGASHPPKKLRRYHGTPSGTSVGGKSRSALHRLLAGAVLNAEVGVVAIPTLHFVTTSVSTTPEREGGDHADSVTEPNLRTIGALSSVLIMTTATTITSTADPTSVAKEKLVEPSPFGAGSSSAGETDPTMGVFSYLTGSDFLVGVIRTVINPDTDLQKVYVPQWSVKNGSHLDDGRLFTEFNVDATRQMSLSAEVRMCAEYNVKEKRRLKSVVERYDELLKGETNALRERNVILEKERNALDVKVTELETSAMSKERELTDLNALVTYVKTQNDNLANRVHELEISSFELQEKIIVYENCMDKFEEFQDDRMKVVNDKFGRWLLTHCIELAITNCLNSSEYLSALGATIGKAIEKGMQDGIATGITHGKKGRVLIDVAAYNPFAKVDYISALQHLQNVNFSLLARLKSDKDASVETVMDILRLEGPLAEKPGLNELQPHIDQQIVPIHSSPDKVVVGATALSLALDVSSFRVQKIRENIANQISALRDVFVLLAEPLSDTVLTGTKGAPDTAVATTDITTNLSTTFTSASTIASISVNYYKVMGEDNQAVADEDAASFPNVDDAELNIP
nr:hypothetical protein [Tanacetum cinerariifolium]